MTQSVAGLSAQVGEGTAVEPTGVPSTKRRFQRVYIEITNICNLSCSFCPIEDRNKHAMTLANFERILAQAAPLAKQICLHLMGEPLAHPKFSEILEIAERFGARLMITTNGILIGRYSEQIRRSPAVAQVNFSVQSYLDNYPQKPFEPYLQSLLDFSQLAEETNPELYINLRLWNIDDDPASKNDLVFEFLEKGLDLEINRRIEVGRIKSKKLRHRLYLHFDSRFEWPRLNRPVLSETGRCHALSGHIAIHSDGTVVPCCLDDQAIIKLGNCLETDLTQIIDSPRATRMREGFKQGQLVEDLCRRCSYIGRFSKNKKRALALKTIA